jgi:transcriptional regulator with XRE-family HTH domain
MPGKDLDRTASPAAFIGAEVRLRREARGWSQAKLGEKANLSPSRIAQIETAAIPPTRHNAVALDVALETGGLVDRFIDLLGSTSVFPDWVQQYVHLEAQAMSISSYEPIVLHGLLQTEDYARAIMRAGQPRSSAEQLEVQVQARMQRQALLERDVPPALWFIVEEDALRRPVGGRDVMGKQLEHLMTLAETPTVVVQVLRTEVGAHASLGGSLCLLALRDRPNVAYAEGAFRGQIYESPEWVADYGLAYDLLQTAACSPDESTALIHKAMEDMQT